MSRPLPRAWVLGLLAILNVGAAAPPRPDGVWRAGGAVDPGGAALPDADALRRAYDSADLPRDGETVTIRGRQMCVARERCIDMGWRATTLGALPNGARLVADLHLPRSTRAYVGTPANRYVVLTLIALDANRLRAVLPLCSAAPGSECRNGYQPWQRAGR